MTALQPSSDTSQPWDQILRILTQNGLRAERNGALGTRTTYRVGGTSAIVVHVDRATDLQKIAEVVAMHQITNLMVVGNGSNMLVADDGYNGVAVVLEATGPDEIFLDSDESLVASGHLSLPQLARQSVAAGRCGLEWAVGVPGTVGGGVRMNAGGHGSDMAASVVSANIFDIRHGTGAVVDVADLGLRFRASALSDDHVVISARFATEKSATKMDHECVNEITEIVRWRREHQPGGQNAGSVFVNPGEGNQSAGALIDAAGLRGLRHGSAVVTQKHANFIQSDPDGSADDVVALMCQVQEAVSAHCGVAMRSEIRLVGFGDEISARFMGQEHHDPTVVAAASKLEVIVRNGNLSL